MAIRKQPLNSNKEPQEVVVTSTPGANASNADPPKLQPDPNAKKIAFNMATMEGFDEVHRELDALNDGFCDQPWFRHFIIGTILFLASVLMLTVYWGLICSFAVYSNTTSSRATGVILANASPIAPPSTTKMLLEAANSTEMTTINPEVTSLASMNLAEAEQFAKSAEPNQTALSCPKVVYKVVYKNIFDDYHFMTFAIVYLALLVLAALWQMCGFFAFMRRKVVGLVVYAILLDMITMSTFLLVIFPEMIWHASHVDRKFWALIYAVTTIWDMLLAVYVVNFIIRRKNSVRVPRPQILLQMRVPTVYRPGPPPPGSAEMQVRTDIMDVTSVFVK